MHVAIVGGGPAGCAAAQTLQQQGARVTLVDPMREAPICGGGLTHQAVQMLQKLGLWHQGYTTLEIPSSVWETPSGKTYRYAPTSMEERLHSVDRQKFDAALREQVSQKGVTLISDRVLALQHHRKTVTLTGERGNQLQADVVFMANGHEVRRFFRKVNPIGGRAVAAILDFPVQWQKASFYLSPCVLPGYAWIFPWPGNRMSIGAKLTPHRHGQALRFLRGLSPTPDYHVTYRPLCSNRVPNHLVPRNMFLLGDAAGLVDPLTGEGISYALESGFLAANCLSHSPDPTEARQRYEILLRSRYSLLRLVSRMGYQFAKSTELTEIGSRMMGSEIWASFAARWFGQGTPLPF